MCLCLSGINSFAMNENGALAPAKTPPSSVEWKHVEELEYCQTGVTNSGKNQREAVCFHCGKPAESSQIRLLQCGKCRIASYCHRECQVSDWKKFHKKVCSSLARVGPNMSIGKPEDQVAARNFLYNRIRFYAGPYAIYRGQTLGRGFIFLQSTQTLAVMSLETPHRDSYGREIQSARSVLMHYLTIGEFDAEVCRDDFELALVRPKLMDAVEAYDERTQVVLLMRFRCGHLALGVAPLVPDFNSAKQVGKLYYENVSAGAVELCIDDS